METAPAAKGMAMDPKRTSGEERAQVIVGGQAGQSKGERGCPSTVHSFVQHVTRQPETAIAGTVLSGNSTR